MNKKYCKYCNKWVAKGMKYYNHRHIKDREVCGGGCNTDWSELCKCICHSNGWQGVKHSNCVECDTSVV